MTPDSDVPGTGPQAAPGPLQPGTVVAGKYRIERMLGEGAIGTVYLSSHPRLDLPLAVKVLRSAIARDRESVDRFERGARNLSRVNHPNVCRLYDFGEMEDGRLFLVMEYVEGESLAELIERESPLPSSTASQITLHICRALHAAHEAGIVHRDLKPGNVMLSRTSKDALFAKVVDFDIAKEAAAEGPAEVTRVGYVIGTPEYMSPEQITGEDLDGRSDIYSAGTILYRALTGDFPFDKPTTQALMLARLTEAPIPLSQRTLREPLPAGLAQVVERALAREPDARFAQAAEFAMALAPFAEAPYPVPPVKGASGEATLVVPETRVEPAAEQPRVPLARPSISSHASRRNALIGGAVVALAVVAAGVGWRALTNGAGAGDATPTSASAEVGRERAQPIPPGSESPERESAAAAADSGGSASDSVPPDPPTQSQGGASGPSASEVQSLVAQVQGLHEAVTRASEDLASDPAQTLREVRSPAEATYAREDLPSVLRADAACVLARALQLADDNAGARAWKDRSLRLDPDNLACSTLPIPTSEFGP